MSGLVTGSSSDDPRREAARRRRLAEVFGEDLPDQTSDDRDDPGERRGDADEWLRRQVPPHHGG